MSTQQIIDRLREAQKLMSFGYWDAASDILDEVIKAMEEQL